MASDAQSLNDGIKNMAVTDTFVNTKAQPSTADTIQHTGDAKKEHRYCSLGLLGLNSHCSLRYCCFPQRNEASDGVAVAATWSCVLNFNVTGVGCGPVYLQVVI